jgi:hypothetical protein
VDVEWGATVLPPAELPLGVILEEAVVLVEVKLAFSETVPEMTGFETPVPPTEAPVMVGMLFTPTTIADVVGLPGAGT